MTKAHSEINLHASTFSQSNPLLRLPVSHIPVDLPFLLRLEFLNLSLNVLIQPRLQLLSIPKLEQNLHPYKERRQEERLNEVIQQCRCPPLVLSVPDELGEPAHDMDCDSYLIRERVVVGGKIVGEGCGGDY